MPTADVMLVLDAPGPDELAAGVPIAGRAAALLDELLAGAGVEPASARVVTLLPRRPEDGRDPAPAEVAAAREAFVDGLAELRPVVVCPLGSFVTRVLRGETAGAPVLHGRAEVRVLGTLPVRLLPLLHPAAALYRDELVERMRMDVGQIPGLLALGPPEDPSSEAPVDEPPLSDQLGLF